MQFGANIIGYFLYCILSIFSCSCYSQNVLKGKVVDKISGEPIPSASVYISKTSVGARTNAEGQFYIGKFPSNNFILVASSVGYNVAEMNLQTSKLPDELIIPLERRANELNAITVSPYEKNGWRDWGDIFVENLIGTSPYARHCKIKNHEALKFRMRHKDSTLLVDAGEPLVIENSSLGYELRFDLQKFSLTFSDSGNTLFYSGHPFFRELPAKSFKEQMRIIENRKKAYYLSLMRFMQTLFSDSAQNDYAIQQLDGRNIFNVPLPLKKSDSLPAFHLPAADTVYEMGSDMVNIKIIMLNERSVTSQATNNKIISVSGSLAVGASVFSFSDQQISMYFTGRLAISIYKIRDRSGYIGFLGSEPSGNALMSTFELKKNEAINIYANGTYSDPSNLKITGFWAWWEKLATILPVDYDPAQ